MTVTEEPLTERGSHWATVAEEIGAATRPHAAAHDRDGDFVHGAFAMLRARGVTAMLVPEEFGGPGATHSETCDLLRVLGQSCGATAVTLSMHSHLVAAQVWRHLHGQDASGVLTRVAGEGLVLVSTGAADWVSSYGKAERADGGYVVSARKMPSSGAPVGDVAVTSFPLGDDEVVHCSVPMNAPGVSIEETWDTLGMRATGSHTVVFDEVFVPDAAVSLIRPAGAWHPIWNVVIGAALPLVLSAYVGIAEAAVDVAVAQVRGRSDEDHVVALVGEMHNQLTIATDAVDAMVRIADDLRFDNTDDIAVAMLTRKSIAAEALVETVRRAIDVVGGAGYSRHLPLERHLRDVLGCSFHPLPLHKQVRFTGRVLLGASPV